VLVSIGGGFSLGVGSSVLGCRRMRFSVSGSGSMLVVVLAM
jgi:hypothetical protein